MEVVDCDLVKALRTSAESASVVDLHSRSTMSRGDVKTSLTMCEWRTSETQRIPSRTGLAEVTAVLATMGIRAAEVSRSNVQW